MAITLLRAIEKHNRKIEEARAAGMRWVHSAQLMYALHHWRRRRGGVINWLVAGIMVVKLSMVLEL